MRKNKGLYLQQMAAAVLMAVFVFIHAVKLLHHHDLSAQSHHALASGQTEVKASDCSICDYHFVKDGSSALHFFTLTLPSLPPVAYTGYALLHPTSIGLSSSDRGPPALA